MKQEYKQLVDVIGILPKSWNDEGPNQYRTVIGRSQQYTTKASVVQIRIQDD